MENYLNKSLQDINGEIWLDVVGMEGKYKVSNMGRIKSIERDYVCGFSIRKTKEVILSQRFRNGYLASKIGSVHRIVARAFIFSDDYSLHINHKNGIKTDNLVKNLEWCTPSENNIHAWKIGLCNETTRKKMSDKAKLRVGRKNSCWRGMVEIKELNGDLITTVETLQDAADWVKKNSKFSKASKGNISLVCNGKLNQLYGFKYNYKRVKNV
jgi:hypothetical protein